VTADQVAGQSAAGVIHDLGYRRYEGPRHGRPGIIRALWWHSVRSAFGFGRGAKAKIVPVAMFAIMCLPAIINAVAVASSPGTARLIDYDTYVFQLRTLVMIIFLAVQAPELVSRDLRSRVLPLYLSRPMRRLDYPLAKYLALTTACLVVLDVPLLILYAGTIVSVKNASGVWSETRALIPGLLIGVLWSVVLAAIAVALASLTGRRAYATGTIAIYFFLTWTLAGILSGFRENGEITTTVRLGGLVSPFTTLDGVRQWLGGAASAVTTPPPGSAGPVFGLMALALLTAALLMLAARYRKAGA
jgi:ABC-2 type transport system permease protein